MFLQALHGNDICTNDPIIHLTRTHLAFVVLYSTIAKAHVQLVDKCPHAKGHVYSPIGSLQALSPRPTKFYCSIMDVAMTNDHHSFLCFLRCNMVPVLFISRSCLTGT